MRKAWYLISPTGIAMVVKSSKKGQWLINWHAAYQNVAISLMLSNENSTQVRRSEVLFPQYHELAMWVYTNLFRGSE